MAPLTKSLKQAVFFNKTAANSIKLRFMQNVFICLPVLLVLSQAISARPLVKIQQVRALNYPYIKAEVTVSKITPLLNLNHTHFQIFENGWQVGHFQVQKVEPQRDPKHLALLVDTSRSILPRDFRAQIHAAREFVRNAAEHDKLAVLSFDDKANVACDFTADKQVLDTCLAALKQGGKRTALYDTILLGYQLVEKLRQSQREQIRDALVIFTDGREENSIIKLDDLLRRAERLQVPIFVAGTGHRQKLKSLARLAKISGGEAYHAASSEDLKKVFHLLSIILDTNYLIQYVSQAAANSEDGRKVNLEVRVSLPPDAEHPNGTIDSDSYTYYLPEGVSNTAWQKILHDERLLFFAGGLILLLLLIIILLVILRRPTREKTSAPQDLQAVVPLHTEKLKLEPKEQKKNQPRLLPNQYHAYLIEKEGPHTGRKYRIQWNVVTIGYGEENSIKLDDNAVSLRHAQIERKDGHFVLYDLLSENGTYLNGKKLLRPKPLNDFDEIQVGLTKLIFRQG